MGENKHFIIFLSAASAIGLIVTFFFIESLPFSGTVTTARKHLIDQIITGDKESLPQSSETGGLPPTQPSGQLVIDPDLPENLQNPQDLPSGLNIASLKPVDDIKGKAVAIRILDDTNSAIAIEATITDPPAGQEYYGWLSDGQTFHLLDKLVKTKDKYTLAAKPKIDLSNFNQVTISLGKTNDNQPQSPILQGSF